MNSKAANQKVPITKSQRTTYIFILGFVLMFQTLVTDMFLPAFPKIAAFFQVPDAFVQYSLSAVTLGAAIGFFAAGPLSDSIGRKKPVLISLALLTASSIALYFAPGIEAFVFLRFLQGLAAAAAAVVSQAIIRDLFVGQAMLKMLGRVFLIIGSAPIVSPFIAAQLLLVAPDWRIVPIALGACGAIILLLASKALIETLHVDDRRAKGFEGVNRRFIAVFKDRIFLGLVMLGMLQTVALFSYLNSIPFLYQETFGLTPVEFSLMFSITAICWFLAIQAGARLARVIKAQWVIFLALVVSLFAGAGLAFVAIQGLGISAVIPFMALFMISFGLSITPIQTIALQGHGAEAGTAASVLGVMNSFTAAVSAPLYPIVGSASSFNLGITVLITHLLAILVFFVIVRPRTVPALVQE